MNQGRPIMEPPGLFEKYKIIIVFVLAFLIAFGVAYFRAAGGLRLRVKSVVTYNGWKFQFNNRIGTGLQRADDIAFFADGSRLAMSCPRYTKFTLWSSPAPGTISPATKTPQLPTLLKTIDLEGRPQRLVPYKDFMIFIERPPGDDRHIIPGFYEVFDKEGVRVAGPIDIGWDPDDMSLVERDGKLYGLILLSGNTEGEENRPNPSVKIVEIDPVNFKYQEILDVELKESKQQDEDPVRLIAGIYADKNKNLQHVAMVTLGRNGAVRKLNWTDLKNPVWESYWDIPNGEPLGASLDSSSSFLITIQSGTGKIFQLPLNPDAEKVEETKNGVQWSAVHCLPNQPEFEMMTISEQNSVFGIFSNTGFMQHSLHGAFGFGAVRPMEFAVHAPAPNQYWIAICDRSGGLHWVTMSKP